MDSKKNLRTKIRDNEARRLATIDPHSPGSVRSQLPPWNHPKFQLKNWDVLPYSLTMESKKNLRNGSGQNLRKIK